MILAFPRPLSKWNSVGRRKRKVSSDDYACPTGPPARAGSAREADSPRVPCRPGITTMIELFLDTNGFK